MVKKELLISYLKNDQIKLILESNKQFFDEKGIDIYDEELNQRGIVSILNLRLMKKKFIVMGLSELIDKAEAGEGKKETLQKKSIPKKSGIVQYWSENKTNNLFYFDLGQPF